MSAKKTGLFTALLFSLTGAFAQNMYIGSSNAMHIHNGATMSAGGDVTATANIATNGSGRLQLCGNSNQFIDMNNYQVGGLTVNKSGGKAILVDSITVGQLDLIQGKMLLYSGADNGFTLHISGKLSNASAGTRVLVGSRNSTVKFSGAGNNFDTLYLSADTLNHSNYLRNLFVGNALRLDDTINIAGLVYVNAPFTFDAGSPAAAQDAFMKLAVFSATEYGQLQFEDGATLAGKATLGQLVSVSNTWIHWGSPFAASNNTTYQNAISDDVTLFYADAPVGQSNIFYYDESAKSANSNSFWARVAAGSNQIPRGRGHAMYSWEPGAYQNMLPVTPTYVLDITGNLTADAFSGTYTANQNNGVQHSDSTGWQIISNPYYSNIDLSALDITDVSNIQGNTIYFYQTHNDVAQYNNPPLAYNFHLDNSNNGASPYVRPMQALYFRLADTLAASQQVTFPVKIQGSGNTAVPMWKGKQFSDILQVKALSDADTNIQDATTLFFMPGASNGYDKNDAFKFAGDYSINLYTTYSDDASRKMSYNALADNAPENLTVPLSFTAQKNGKYTLRFNLTEADLVKEVILEDKTTNTFTQLNSADAYTFDHSTTATGNRFVIHFNKNTGGTTSAHQNTGNTTPVNIYTAAQRIHVQLNQAAAVFSVNVYNLLGQELSTGSFSGDQAVLDTYNLASGYYLVSVNINGTVKTQKVFVQ